MKDTVDFSFIIGDNESTVRNAMNRGDYVQAILLVHCLVESLLRTFLGEMGEEIKFSALVKRYENFLQAQSYSIPTFTQDLLQFNKRRNRIVHQLWRKGYTFTNRQAEDAARVSVFIYGLLIEFLETFDGGVVHKGFKYDNE
ncbi:MAG: hypothetical protein M1461_01025 [Nitrospirae bacterium]|nr:hypothetical protein [Nitrospirota bacterium]